ncbi:unnamed protein product [Meloidogyne enterolobii]|uniref:Uncharacterized protein n=1 Tax=Meloidogyne enterolobii TaxID=390850 RepID=A0ACB1B2J2_MELEN
MFRNQYDSDVTVFSPQGRLHQNDYAVEAMRQGSATVALHGKDHAVVVALMRSQSELSSYQSKIFELDGHVGLSMSGLLADGRILARFIQNECATFFSELQTPLPIENLRTKLTLRMQENIQVYGKRPFGVGLLIIGYDDSGPHVINADPSANVTMVKAASIGARSQSARTYLEKHFDEYANSTDQNVVIRHALLALKETLQTDTKLDENNTAIAVVGKRCKFGCLPSEQVKEIIASLNNNQAPEPMQL